MIVLNNTYQLSDAQHALLASFWLLVGIFLVLLSIPFLYDFVQPLPVSSSLLRFVHLGLHLNLLPEK